MSSLAPILILFCLALGLALGSESEIPVLIQYGAAEHVKCRVRNFVYIRIEVLVQLRVTPITCFSTFLINLMKK